MLRRYWFTFDRIDKPSPLNLGCGVTAFSREDALNLLREYVFVEKEVPVILEVTEDVDVSTLDRDHVAPNIGLVTQRGIWFPMGFGTAE